MSDMKWRYLHFLWHPSILQPGPAVPHGASDLFTDRETFHPQTDSSLVSKLQLQAQSPPLGRADLHLQMVQSGVIHPGLRSVGAEGNQREAKTWALMLAGSPSFLRELSVCLKWL